MVKIVRRIHPPRNAGQAIVLFVGVGLVISGIASVSIPIAIVLAGLVLIGLGIEVTQ